MSAKFPHNNKKNNVGTKFLNRRIWAVIAVSAGVAGISSYEKIADRVMQSETVSNLRDIYERAVKPRHLKPVYPRVWKRETVRACFNELATKKFQYVYSTSAGSDHFGRRASIAGVNCVQMTKRLYDVRPLLNKEVAGSIGCAANVGWRLAEKDVITSIAVTEDNTQAEFRFPAWESDKALYIITTVIVDRGVASADDEFVELMLYMERSGAAKRWPLPSAEYRHLYKGEFYEDGTSAEGELKKWWIFARQISCPAVDPREAAAIGTEGVPERTMLDKPFPLLFYPSELKVK